MESKSEPKNHWSLGLIESLNNPKLRVLSSDIAVVIKDKYPKARYHFLILPLINIASIYHLTKNNLELLNEINLLAKNVIEVTGQSNDNFKIGYHMSPSMQRLHLHVISNDFDSPCLKSKIHWNSFNTEFFLSPAYVYESIEKYGKLKKPSQEHIKQLLNNELKCNQCSYKPKNLPDLKQHLKRHSG